MSDMLDTEEDAGKRRFSATSPGETVVPATNGSASSTGAGAMLRLIRDGRASTRAELVALTGLARSTVAQRMDALLAQRLVTPPRAGPPPRRPRRRERLDRRPPAQDVRLQPQRGSGPGGRPRGDPLARRGHRP